MSEWKALKLEDILTKVTDNRGKNPPMEVDGIPVIETSALTSKRRYADEGTFQKFVSNETYETWFRSGHPNFNDLLIATVGNGIGSVALMPDLKASIAQNIIGLGFKPEFGLGGFYYYYFNQEAIQYFLRGMDIGSAQPSLKLPHLLSLDIPVPTIEEQTAIVEVLSSLDDKIDLLHRQNKTLEQLAETLFRQWFVVEAEESWELTTLGEHTEAFRGLSYKGDGLTDVGNGLPMHNLNSVYEFGGYKEAGIKYYKGEYKERHLVNAGDIIVTNTEQGHEFRLIGFPGIVPKHFGESGLFSQHIYRLIPKPSTYLSNQFLYYLLMVPAVREQITAATNGSTVNMLAIEGLQLPAFKLPNKSRVEEFTLIVRDYWSKKELNTTQIRTLTQLRDTLLPKLMSGEVRVNNN